MATTTAATAAEYGVRRAVGRPGRPGGEWAWGGCLLLAAAADGREVLMGEGIVEGEERVLPSLTATADEVVAGGRRRGEHGAEWTIRTI